MLFTVWLESGINLYTMSSLYRLTCRYVDAPFASQAALEEDERRELEKTLSGDAAGAGAGAHDDVYDDYEVEEGDGEIELVQWLKLYS